MTSAPEQLDEVTLTTGGAASHASAALARGQTVGRYVVLDRIGMGGMGIVYSAYDPKLDRKVAVKVLHPARHSRRYHALMVTEARALARLSHPNVVGVFDVGDEEDAVFIAMEFIDGIGLDCWLTEAPAWGEIVDRFVLAGRGLAAAHDAGLVHGDFKPANVMTTEDGRVVVMDFGLAQLPEGSDDGHAFAGTPRYMSPEQHAHVSLTAASDQFSFCVALYEALFATHPFGGGTPTEIVAAVTDRQATIPDSGEVPPAIVSALGRGLEREPNERWPDMRTLLDALEQVRHPASRRWWVMPTVALSVALPLAAWALSSRGGAECEDPRTSWDDLWDGATRAKVRASLDRDAGPEPAAHVVETLDRYVEEWSEQRRDACEATRVRHEQSPGVYDRRVACLQTSLEEVAHVIALFRRGDPAIAVRAVELVSEMAPVARCTPDALAAAVAQPTEGGAEVASIREELAQGRALRKAALFEEAEPRLTAALERALQSGHEPVIAEAQLELGMLREGQENPRAANEAFEEAAWRAQDSDHHRIALEAAIQLVGIEAYQHMDVERSEAWERRARRLLQRWPDPLAEARLEGAAGGFLARGSDIEGARERLEHAVELFRANDDTQSAAYFDALRGLGAAHYRLGKRKKGVGILEECWQSERAVFGERDPEVASTYLRIGTMHSQMGQREQGERELLQAKEWLEAAPVVSRHLGGVYNNLGNHYLRGNDVQRAREYFDAAARAWERPRRFPDSLVYAYSNLAGLSVAEERWDDAREYAQRALNLIDDSQAGRHALRGIVLATLALGRSKTGTPGVWPLLDECLAILAEEPRAGEAMQLRVARALAGNGEPTRARKLIAGVKVPEGDETAQHEYEAAMAAVERAETFEPEADAPGPP